MEKVKKKMFLWAIKGMNMKNKSKKKPLLLEAGFFMLFKWF